MSARRDAESLAERVEHWRERVIPEWRVTLLDKPDDDDVDRAGWCRVNCDLLHLHIWVNTKDFTEAEVDETIVHELLHAVFQPLENCLDDISTHLSYSQMSHLRSSYLRAMEPAVERISLLITSRDGVGWTRWKA